MTVFFWGVSALMDESLEKALLDMESRDRALRAELTALGELDHDYPRKLEELHRANATRLRQMIAVFGWPGTMLVGTRGAQAAWRIALNSMAEPAFMRQCRDLLNAASENGDVPRWQFAMLDDRIRVYEGRPQRYGTQLRLDAAGLEPYAPENDSRVNSMRMRVGLPPLHETLAKARAQPHPSAAAAAAREKAELEFRRTVGWIV